MSSSTRLIKPPSEEYDDEVLYGQRLEAARAEALRKVDKDSECVMHAVGTAYIHKQHWNIKNLTGNDSRLIAMMNNLGILHTLPLQRFAWPQIERAEYPILSVSPEATGKTLTHLLYVVTRCISAKPLTKTNELLYKASGVQGSFKTTDDHTSSKLPINLEEIDQDNFDFDSLGAIPVKVNSKEQANGTDPSTAATDGTEANGWNLNTEEHFDVDAEEFIFHPKYIIVSSNQHQVEFMEREVDRMKLAAFGTDRAANIRLDNLPPKVKTLNIHYDEAKLALKCNEAEILIATPGPLMKCFDNQFLDFTKCKKIFFDDLDLTLQLHNTNVKELVKYFLIATQCTPNDDSSDNDPTKRCQIYFFSRKWTDLVKNFLKTVFPQIIIMFGSIAEAALYANMRYDLEHCLDSHKSRIAKLINLIELSQNDNLENTKIAVVCNNDSEAEKISQIIGNLEYNVKYLPRNTPLIALRSRCTTNGIKNHHSSKPLFIMGDGALDVATQELTDITCIIHYSMPKTMLQFDQRFRLMYGHIKELRKEPISTTIFLGSHFDSKHAKEIYDMMSRSSTTLKSTKLELRDLITDTSNTICWRWASSGVCRLEKLSREDRFGTYCSDKHSVASCKAGQSTRYPTSGQLKITITHLVSPNEFYFWFEAHRDKESPAKKWTQLESAGSGFMRKLQAKLDQLKDTGDYSVQPVDRLKKGKIFGVYLQQEKRVDRVRLIEDPAIDRDMSGQTKYGYKFSKQCEVYKVDYGFRIHVYLRKLFELPDELADIEPQCHRGFHLGVKPTDNEPDWVFKAKQCFYDLVCRDELHEITVWLRLNSNNCFWFEKMTIACKLGNIDNKRLYTSEPHLELIKAQLAAKSTGEPSCLNPSERLLTLSKWHVEQSEEYVQYAFLRRDKPLLDIFVMHIWSNLDMTVRQYDYNKQLIDLEQRMLEDFNNGQFCSLNYFKAGVYCLAKIHEGDDPATKKPIYTINRARIWGLEGDEDQVMELRDNKITVDCLDHGDQFEVDKADLYHAAPDYLSQLPFQAIKERKLADLNPEIFNNLELMRNIQSKLYDFTRTETDQLAKVACRINNNGKLLLYIPRPTGIEGRFDYESIGSLFKKLYEIDLTQ